MSFVSYAQNFEDVMLWRALRHIKNGYYIDVGAFSADEDSVTRAFYDQGWSGINIEPNPKYHEELVARRDRDINLRVAVSDRAEDRALYVIDDTGLTTLEPDIAEMHREKGFSKIDVVVPALTLEEIWTTHVPQDQDVHFLKIDVEGHELPVIKGLDWDRHRPWIVVVESTLPATQQLSETGIVEALAKADYEAVYWDGLNRYYVAKERAELTKYFDDPPNVFDGFRRSSEVEFEQRALQAEAELYLEREHVVRISKENWDHVHHALEVKFSALQEAMAAEAQAARRDVTQELVELRMQLSKQGMTSSFWTRFFFRPTGKPKKALRRLLFHTNGKPRGIFRNRVLKSNGQPRPAFLRWMASAEYQQLRRAVKVAASDESQHVLESGASTLSQNEGVFVGVLQSARTEKSH
ncbi:FkbM family methyltransferase [Jannaschia sp. CCS1]|uniref:FkbM family methyltransferase n=1 Tax=Jannaschia sp. (strain CCS1) TaxID=290400 RepID=UPI000053D80E|nr:FkbM family methyltransferase [Jannaschia sp. CCS1]ABD57198.1 Methyltransferase FkbM [Jannaschia sp. CCS1]